MSFTALALFLLIAGFVVTLAGMLLLTLYAVRRGGEGGHVEGGAVIILGPLPIVLGTSERATKALVLLAIALTLVALAFFLVFSYMLGVGR